MPIVFAPSRASSADTPTSVSCADEVIVMDESEEEEEQEEVAAVAEEPATAAVLEVAEVAAPSSPTTATGVTAEPHSPSPSDGLTHDLADMHVDPVPRVHAHAVEDAGSEAPAETSSVPNSSVAASSVEAVVTEVEGVGVGDAMEEVEADQDEAEKSRSPSPAPSAPAVSEAVSVPAAPEESQVQDSESEGESSPAAVLARCDAMDEDDRDAPSPSPSQSPSRSRSASPAPSAAPTIAPTSAAANAAVVDGGVESEAESDDDELAPRRNSTDSDSGSVTAAFTRPGPVASSAGGSMANGSDSDSDSDSDDDALLYVLRLHSFSLPCSHWCGVAVPFLGLESMRAILRYFMPNIPIGAMYSVRYVVCTLTYPLMTAPHAHAQVVTAAEHCLSCSVCCVGERVGLHPALVHGYPGRRRACLALQLPQRSNRLCQPQEVRCSPFLLIVCCSVCPCLGACPSR